MRAKAWLAGAFLVAATAAAVGQGDAAQKCAGLTAVNLGTAVATKAELVAAGAGVAGVKLTPAVVAAMPAFCRVQITDTPSKDSDIRIEVWLPVAGWNGRFRGTGNGGFAGTIYLGEMAAAVMQGYAVAGTNTGHVGGSTDAEFALGHPEKVTDFGWRAVHDMTVDAKKIVAAFYGKPAAKAYFASCSDGGREALMEAQRFPADYDGILAGAPAYNWTGLITGGAVKMKAMQATPESKLPAAKIPAIAAAVRAACDAKDGVRDGVLNDPRECGFDPATMACKDGDAANCLTPVQAATLKNMYAPTLDSTGKEIVPGMLPGAEEGGNGWATWITGTAKDQALGVSFGQGFFANFVHGDPDWKLESFDPEKDLKLAREKTAAALDARDTNLQPFAGRGGKLILYHGWNDPAIPALMTVEYFDGVRKTMGDKVAGESVRLYMVPGMQHCSGGPGATEFGQGGGNPRGDAEHDVFTALEDWVEKGKAAGTIVAERVGADKKVEFTRPLCAYPKEARYVKGDQGDAGSFACVAPVK